MSEPLDPRRPRKTDRVGDEDVYDLVDNNSDVAGGDETSATPRPSPLDDDPELDESASAAPRSASRPPAAPLPRLWKAEPDPEEAPSRSATESTSKRDGDRKARRENAKPSGSGGIERVGSVRRSSDKSPAPPKNDTRRKRSRDEKSSKEGSGVLIEETPNLDTYAARQTARIIFGFVGLGVCLMVGFFIVRALMPSAAPEADPTDTVAVQPVNSTSARDREVEARLMYRRAEDVARKGNVDVAIDTLTKVTTKYSGTKAARDAKEALERPKRNLPLFLDTSAVLASKADPKIKKETPETPTEPDRKAVVVLAEASSGPVASAPAPMPTPTPTSTSTSTPTAPPVDPASPGQPAGGLPSATLVAPGVGTPEPSVGRPLPKGFRSKPGTQVDASGWPLEIVGDRDDSTMVLVPGGDFTMGRNDGEPDERPAHQVKVSTFYIDQHEVTVRQYENFQRMAGRRADRDSALAREEKTLPTSEDSPVIMVSAKDARDYAGWAHKKLPTEAQWEMAARGHDGRVYPWGIAPPDWGKKREPRKISPVMSYDSDVSPYGVYDMAGNACEWTKDWYDPRFYQVVKGRVQEDPAGPSFRPPSQELVIKGGSKNWFVPSREGLRHDKRLKHVGFRCVLAVEGPDSAFESDKAKSPNAPGGGGAPAGVSPF